MLNGKMTNMLCKKTDKHFFHYFHSRMMCIISHDLKDNICHKENAGIFILISFFAQFCDAHLGTNI